MKAYRSKPIKTEQSPQKSIEANKNNKKITFHSVIKNKRKSPTPRRFADVLSKNLQSTNDNKDSVRSKEANSLQPSIANAINVLKQNSTLQEPKSITPFSICQQTQPFQEELSFKGANNRLLLLAKVNQIQQETDKIFQVVKNINKNSSIDFITFKLLKEKQKEIRLSYYDFYSHLGTLTNRINDFVVELDRCRIILNKLPAGISFKTMKIYRDRFQTLIGELTNSTKYLQNYIEGLKKDQRGQKKVLKKYMLGLKE